MRSAAAVFIVLLIVRRNGQTLWLIFLARPESRKQQISSSKSEHFVPLNKKKHVVNWNIKLNGFW
jgi:hypothetical protein